MAYAIITGGSKGIGKCIALELAARGFHLVLIARSGEELNLVAAELKGKYPIEVITMALDLSSPDAANKIAEFCLQANLDVEVLVNNAGYGLGGLFESYSLEDIIAMMKVNMEVPVALTKRLLPILKKRPGAFILNVASSAAYQAVPGLSLYAASKSFLLSFSRGLRQELKGTNLSVSCLCPGPTDTNFGHRAQLGPKAMRLAEKVNMTAAEVAKIGVRGMLAKKAEIIPGFMNKLTAGLSNIIPDSLLEDIAKKIYRI